jgi:hypothetical protein
MSMKKGCLALRHPVFLFIKGIACIVEQGGAGENARVTGLVDPPVDGVPSAIRIAAPSLPGLPCMGCVAAINPPQ